MKDSPANRDGFPLPEGTSIEAGAVSWARMKSIGKNWKACCSSRLKNPAGIFANSTDFPRAFQRFCQERDMHRAYLVYGEVESEFNTVSLNVLQLTRLM